MLSSHVCHIMQLYSTSSFLSFLLNCVRSSISGSAQMGNLMQRVEIEDLANELEQDSEVGLYHCYDSSEEQE